MSANTKWLYEGGELVAYDLDGRLRKSLRVDEAIGWLLAHFLNAAPALGRTLSPP
jgi:hypothetical protein